MTAFGAVRADPETTVFRMELAIIAAPEDPHAPAPPLTALYSDIQEEGREEEKEEEE